MTATIEEGGLKLLACLSEHAGQVGQRFWLDPKPVVRSLGISQEEFALASGYLVEHGFAGKRMFSVGADTAPVASVRCCAIWLTGSGENHLRELQASPGVGGKLTVGVVGK
jgi:hypothetical protein